MRATQAYPIPRRTLDTRAYRTIEVTPVTPTAGAEVRGVDLSRPLGEEQFAEIQDAFLRHLVLFFRGQRRLTPEEQIRFGHRFGPLHLQPAAPHAEGYPEVMIVRTDRDSKVHNGETWHSDVACDAEPPLGSLLQFLFRHVESPYYQVRFRWQQDDVALWDNRCTQHLAIWDYWPHERQGHRVAIKGDRPFYRG